MSQNIGTAYLAPEGYCDPLIQELDGILEIHGRLILTDRPLQAANWAQNIWFDPVYIPIESISDGAEKLKSIQRNWWLYSSKLHRRGALIHEKLPHVSAKPLKFPSPLPKSPLGSWTLLSSNLILASSRCSSLFPNGEMNFEEDRKGPPNRAYLKLWEALELAQKFPQTNQFCIDAGGSPGGWTWALQKLGATVLSVDRSPLDPEISGLPRVIYRKGDVFLLTPEEFKDRSQKVDWMFCDVVCYPEKLFEWVKMWVDSGVGCNFICTVKFQGKENYSIAKKFLEIKSGKLIHLFHNRHELTWILLNRGKND